MMLLHQLIEALSSFPRMMSALIDRYQMMDTLQDLRET